MKPGSVWPIGIAAILASSVVGNLYMMRVANADPAFAIEDDYYQRAVDFDSTMHRQRASDALGWSADIAIDRSSNRAGTLRVSLHSRDGQPINADSVTAIAFFNARANERTTVHLAHGEPAVSGNYAGSLPIAHAGQWEVHLDAWRGGSDHFVHTARVEVTEAPTVPSARVPSAGVP